MRANTKKKHKMGRRFAIVIGLAATGVMALGAQTGEAASEGVVKYDSKVTIDSKKAIQHGTPSYPEGFYIRGSVESESSKCELGRRVIVFKQRPGADRKLGTARSFSRDDHGLRWRSRLPLWVAESESTVYAKVTRWVARLSEDAPPDATFRGFVCRADRSRTIHALGAQTATAAEVATYDSKVTINWRASFLSANHGFIPELWYGEVRSKARKCQAGRLVILFRKRPGPDRKLGATRSFDLDPLNRHRWHLRAPKRGRVYAKVGIAQGGRGVQCRADYSHVILNGGS